MKVGFIGLGIMGGNMASNLLKAGYEVYLYNRSPHIAEALKSHGGIVLDSPAAVANRAEVLITMLGDPDAVHSTAFGADGFLDNLSRNSLWMDVTTVDPGFAGEMAKAARQRSIHYMDAPVLGSKAPAENGELVFLIGGDQRDLDLVRPLLEVMGKAIQHVGAQTKGAAMKMVFNHQLGQAMAAFAEAVNLGSAMGLNEQEVRETLLKGPVTAPFLEGKREKFNQEDYSAEFPLKWMQKDLQLASKAAYEAQKSLFMANTAKELYQLAQQNGWSDADFSAIYAYFQSLNKPEDA